MPSNAKCIFSLHKFIIIGSSQPRQNDRARFDCNQLYNKLLTIVVNCSQAQAATQIDADWRFKTIKID